MKPNKRGRDFKVLELKLNKEAVHPHVVYIKEHSVREHSEGKPSGRTLLVLNVPPYAGKPGLCNAFSKIGNIQHIIFSQTPNTEDVKTAKFIEDKLELGFKLAFIVFEKVSDLDKALQLKRLLPLNSEKHVIKCGMAKWIEEYNSSIICPKVLKEQIDEFMKKHDEETRLAEENEKKLEQADEEGWMTVTKGGKVKSFARSEKVENKILAKEEKGKKRKELKNFYTFQIRESKMKHIVSLREKFEEDKKKIAQIKHTRRFKPF